jgi:hypothetical protein
MGKHISILTTTINMPTFLIEYYSNLRKSHLSSEDITFIIVGDNKTPYATEKFVDKYLVKEFPTEYWSPEKQYDWLRKTFPNKEKATNVLIPENDMRRRNFGYLRAAELNSDVIITIDDDNYPLHGHDWLAEHINNLNNKKTPCVSSINSYVNPCKVLTTSLPIYSRGYPLPYLFTDTFDVTKNETTDIVLNMGLWTNKPDVDSYTNLLYPELKIEYPSDKNINYAIKKNNFFSINTQNTSFKKELSVFHNLYMEPVHTLPNHRFDDIWIGLFCLKLLFTNNKTASFGCPVVEHRRNTHNYQKDLQTEFLGIAVNTNLWEFIAKLDSIPKGYTDGFLKIASEIDHSFTKRLTDTKMINYFHRLTDSMRMWVDLMDVVQC